MEHSEVATPCASSPQSLSPKSSSSSSSPPRTPPELPESQRADAVSSMVYEASARIRDPVYGCAGAICQLQKQVNELQAQLAKAQAEVVNMQLQQANLVALLCMEVEQSPPSPQPTPHQSVDDFIRNSPQSYGSNPSFLEDNNLESLWGPEPLWT
ncbi:hypothetical protein V6N11_056904 [Hibiscus sabdariffa]|uniref:LOB domain-containing protein n=1 Tax=Hibiscus sabdariffa TaxID=183260 RepID=A0ABR2T5V7_9ROSI